MLGLLVAMLFVLGMGLILGALNSAWLGQPYTGVPDKGLLGDGGD